MSFTRFLTSNPALTPLFAAVGLGAVGAGWYGVHVLRNHQDVMIVRRPEPWNAVRQDQNTKFYTNRPEFFKGRGSSPDPRAVYLSTGQQVDALVEEVTSKAKEKVSQFRSRSQ